MTVGELIDQLRQYDRNREVWLWVAGEGVAYADIAGHVEQDDTGVLTVYGEQV